MAFEIDHHPDAAYHLYQFETAAGGALLEQVDHSLKIMDGVLRHRIIRLKDGTPPPPMPRPEGRSYSEGDAAPVDGDASGAPAADAAVPADGAAADAAAAPETSPEAGQPADAPATAGTAAAEQPAAPADAPAPAPAETPPPPDPADESAGPAGGGGDDEAPSGPTAA
jgi:hypothetical protein